MAEDTTGFVKVKLEVEDDVDGDCDISKTQTQGGQQHNSISAMKSEPEFFDMGLVKTEIKEEMLEENELEDRDDGCSLHDAQVEDSVYNIQEDIECSVEDVKLELFDMKEITTENKDAGNSQSMPIKDLQHGSPQPEISQYVNSQLSPTEDRLHSLSHTNDQSPLRVKAPSRTYKRATTAQKRSSSCCPDDDETEIKKVRKVEDIVQQCLNKEISKKTLKNPSQIIAKKPSYTNSGIAVFIDTATDNSLKVYDRRHECLYCNQRFLNMWKHFIVNHLDKIEVLYVNKLPFTSVPRRRQLIRLMRIGDFLHNARVLAGKAGELIVLRPSEVFLGQCSDDNFVPCPDCVGFVHKYRLSRHHRRCVVKPLNALTVSKRNLLRESRALLAYAFDTRVDHNFKISILDKLMSTFGMVAKTDPLIVRLGQHLMKNVKRKDVNDVVKLTMQKMGCLLLSCRKLALNHRLMLHQIFASENLNMLISTIKTLLSSRSDDIEMFGLYNCLYPQITNCLFLWRGKCLIEQNLNNANKATRFYYKFAEAWEKEIGMIPDENSQIAKIHLDSTLPLTSHVMTLKESLKSEIVKLTDKMKHLKMGGNIVGLWHDLIENTICLLCLFNPLNFEVIQGISVAEYAVRPDWNVDNIEDFKCKMSNIAFHLAQKRTIVSTNYMGKDTVILLTSEIKKAIDILIKKRSQAAIPIENPYVFAIGTKDGTFKAANCFYNLCIKNDMLNNDVLKNMKKRQYISSVTQISDMSAEEVEWIRNYLQTSNTEPNKNFKNPLAQALQVYEINQVFEESKNQMLKEIDQPKCVVREQPYQGLVEDLKLCDVVTSDGNKEKDRRFSKGVIKGNMEVGKNPKTMAYLGHLEKWRANKKWSLVEKQYLKEYFKEEIKNEKLPGKEKCLNCILKSSLLKGRKWKSIKRYVMYEIEVRKKIQEQSNPLFCDF